jgi:hypothetical protein|tara:strand:- start:774 stop:956 length:183 start_codon:yes stop_codon:yes gene_type:complete
MISNTKWKTWFKVYKDPKWYTNGVSFLTENEAIERAKARFRGWTQAQSWEVRKEGDDPND